MNDQDTKTTIEKLDSKRDNSSVKILVVDDEPGIRDLLSYELGSQGYQVSTAENGEVAVGMVKKESFQLIISDIKMPKMDGLETLEAVKRVNPNIEVIMATGYGSIETAVEAMKLGAYDFIQKPFNNMDEIFALIEKVLEKTDLKALVAIHEASKAIFKSIKLDVLLPTIIKISQRVLKSDEVSLMLLEPNGELTVAASLGQVNEKHKQARLLLGERIAGKVALEKEPIIITGSVEEDPRFKGVDGLREIRSSIVYPLIMDDEVLGILNANRITNDEPFSSNDLQSMTIICSQIAQAVFNAKLYQEVEEKVQQLREAYQQLEETQNQLLQTEKLAAIGQLAAGVAHELNNPLTGILGFAQLLIQEEGLTPQQREDMESIYKQSQRCRQIIQNLLQFSHRKEPKKETAYLTPILESTLQLVQYDFTTSGIEIDKRYPEKLPCIYGDPNQLQQVFLNLLTNGRQAVDNKKKNGRIVIKASQENKKVMVSFHDNGIGIEPENMGKIFDPFFTTKPVGKGTGLGLSISYGIVQQHSGTIHVKSEKGKGSTFTVELPVHEE